MNPEYVTHKLELRKLAALRTDAAARLRVALAAKRRGDAGARFALRAIRDNCAARIAVQERIYVRARAGLRRWRALLREARRALDS